jgi:glucuronokinase
MKTVSARTYARAGLLGNPSDGYHGRTISVIVGDYFAEVTLAESTNIEVRPAEGEDRTYRSMEDLSHRIACEGYYGSERLVLAALRKFAEFAKDELAERREPNFTVTLRSSIPRQVGMAGSSAIVMATLRAAMKWYGIAIEPELLASLTLSAERDELGIPAGLQDRVIQAMEGVVFMDFSRDAMCERRGLQVGRYESLVMPDHPPLYVSYSTHGGEPTEVTHSNLRARFMAGDADVIDAMKQFADLATEGRSAWQRSDWSRLSELINANFDLRRSICHLHPHHVEMIETARAAGVSAKFCGSGGAIIGTIADSAQFERLRQAMTAIGCHTIRPKIGHFQPA